MLGKLMKHEFKATGKVMLPLYLGVAALTAMTKLMLMLNGFLTTVGEEGVLRENVFTMVISRMLLFANILMLFGLIVVTVIFAIMRFYKNLLGDEGYLMFTLPVTPAQHLVSKAVTSLCFTLGSGILVVGAGFVLSSSPTEAAELLNGFFAGPPLYIWFLVAFTGILWILCGYLMLYFSMGMGAQFGSNRLLGSILTYVVVGIILQFAAVIGVVSAAGIFASSKELGWMNQLEPYSAAGMLLAVLCVGSILLSTLFFFITRYLLSKRLNLN
ncbi:MAG: hypothetical protein RSC76_07325 [Oscillospiraceae bacterium]